LTCLVALTDIVQGPTELLTTTHKESGIVTGAERVLATLKRGDAVLYDSRTIHRGRGYDVGPPRPTIVMRWDRPETPAPGTGFLGTLVVRFTGSIISLLAVDDN